MSRLHRRLKCSLFICALLYRVFHIVCNFCSFHCFHLGACACLSIDGNAGRVLSAVFHHCVSIFFFSRLQESLIVRHRRTVVIVLLWHLRFAVVPSFPMAHV